MGVLDCLKKHGQVLDREIAAETGIPLEFVRVELTALANVGAVIMCKLTRFHDGQPIASWQCRLSGYVPPKAVGRKPSPIA